jgi:hypothetical protein
MIRLGLSEAIAHVFVVDGKLTLTGWVAFAAYTACIISFLAAVVRAVS